MVLVESPIKYPKNNNQLYYSQLYNYTVFMVVAFHVYHRYSVILYIIISYKQVIFMYEFPVFCSLLF